MKCRFVVYKSLQQQAECIPGSARQFLLECRLHLLSRELLLCQSMRLPATLHRWGPYPHDPFLKPLVLPPSPPVSVRPSVYHHLPVFSCVFVCLSIVYHPVYIITALLWQCRFWRQIEPCQPSQGALRHQQPGKPNLTKKSSSPVSDSQGVQELQRAGLRSLNVTAMPY